MYNKDFYYQWSSGRHKNVNNTDYDDGIISNSSENGTVKWDVLSKEGLEVGAGYYIYHVKSKETGKEKIGKFAIIK